MPAPRSTPIAAASFLVAVLATLALGSRPPLRHQHREPAGSERRAAIPAPSAAHPLDLNAATEAEIEQLPRVGPALAAKIVAERARLGRFHALSELDAVPGVGPRLLERLTPIVRIDAPGSQNRSTMNPIRSASETPSRAMPASPPGP